MGDFRPGGKLFFQNLQRLRVGICRLDDEGIGQRVARQAGDDFGHAFAGLHALQGLFLGHETPLAAGGLAQPAFDFANILLAGLQLHENADLLDAGSGLTEVAQIVENDVAKAGQGQRDADHQQRQQGIERRGAEAAQGRAEGGAVLTEPGLHQTSLP